MMVIRPVSLNDLDQLYELASLASFGLTTLPRDRDILQRRIREAQRGFEKLENDNPQGETYLFVMEDLASGKVVGTSGIVSKVGGFEPFYAYRIETTVHESKMLNVRKEIQTLHLVTEHNGPCEIGSLFLAPDYRKDDNGRMLSLARFLFMAEHPNLFDPVVIAEMRGVIDEQGRSPFWDAVGKHFFEIDFPKADYLSIVNKRFIADLMPRHPLYIPLLPKEAQDIIGKVHKNTVGAIKILESEGFAFSGMVDIFEAGPVMRSDRDTIRTVRESRCVTIGRVNDGPIESPSHLIGNTRRDFRACKGPVEFLNDGTVHLTAACALALGVKIGDRVRLGTLRAERSQNGKA